jgi:hypothetical protein
MSNKFIYVDLLADNAARSAKGRALTSISTTNKQQMYSALSQSFRTCG